LRDWRGSWVRDLCAFPHKQHEHNCAGRSFFSGRSQAFQYKHGGSVVVLLYSPNLSAHGLSLQ
jgi:hypothetical protein